MVRFYIPILILQIFCLYQVLKRKEENKWIWIILFFPLIGGVYYLYDTFYSRRNLLHIKEEVKSSLLSNYKIEKLESQVAFSDTFTNKMLLADEYFSIGNYEKAKEIYESCYNGLYEKDTELLMRLLAVHYFIKEYDAVLKYGNKMIQDKSFNNSEEKIYLAWSCYELGKEKEAEEHFQESDIRFTNYSQRLEYALFLEKIGNADKAKEKLEELQAEMDRMDGVGRKRNRRVSKEIQRYYVHLGGK